MRTPDAFPARSRTFVLSILRLAALAALLRSAPVPLAGQELLVTYLPTFGAQTPNSPGLDSGGHPYSEYWISTAGVFNISDTTQHVVAEDVLGEGLLPEALAACLVDRAYASGEGSLAPCQFYGPPRFVRFRHSSKVVLNAQLGRNRVAGCPAPVQYVLPQGFAPLPTYHRLFQGGERTVAGPVELRTQGFPSDCATPNQVYDRRVNVTVANYGQLPATFTLVAYRFRRHQAGYDPVWSSTVTVDARSVHQVNDIPIPRTLTEPGENRHLGSMSVWLTITSDQPYLGYVSSVFEGGEPGSLPFQVFPLRGAAAPGAGQ